MLNVSKIIQIFVDKLPMKFILILHILFVSSYAQDYSVGNTKINFNNGFCYNSCASKVNSLDLNSRLYLLDQVKNDNPELFKTIVSSILSNEAYKGGDGYFIEMKETYQSVYGNEIVDDDLINIFKAKKIEKQLKLSDDKEESRALLRESLQNSKVSKHFNYIDVFYNLYQSKDASDLKLLNDIFKNMVSVGNSSAADLLMEAHWEDMDVRKFLGGINDHLALEKMYCEVLDRKEENLSEYWAEDCYSRDDCREYIFSHFKEWGDIFESSGITSCNGLTANDWAQRFYDEIDDPDYFDDNKTNKTKSDADFISSESDCHNFSEGPYTFLVKGTDLHFKILLNTINCDDQYARENLADFFYRYGVKAMSASKKANVEYSYMKGVKNKCHFYIKSMSSDNTKFSSMHPFSIEGAYESLIKILKGKGKSH